MNVPVRPLGGPATKDFQATLESVAQGLSQVLVGKRPQLELALTCLLAGGHLLLEDVPGVGKTTLAEALARVWGLKLGRVQFTSDLMPADIVGVQIFQPATGTFQFRPGPLFHPLVLADELNRAPPRTQSALLEAMAQGQVSVDGVTHVLPRPFLVIATQNPVDLSGTYPLPDSQLDRFLMRLSLGHPPPEVEVQLLATRGSTSPVTTLQPVGTPELLLELQARASRAHVHADVADYAVRLCAATRTHPELERGASTRAALALMAAAKARALWAGRDFVSPTDVREMLVPVLAHRLSLRQALGGGSSREETLHLVEELARKIALPK